MTTRRGKRRRRVDTRLVGRRGGLFDMLDEREGDVETRKKRGEERGG